MAVGAILGAALTTPAALGSATYIDNVYVDPLPDSIRITMAGPGSNSSFTFTLDDPGVSVVLAAGSAVRYEHATAGTLFAGFVDSFSYITEFGGQGRQIEVSCTGNEVALDWLTLAIDLTFSANGPGLSFPGEWTLAQAVSRIMTNLARPAAGFGYFTGINSTLGAQITDPSKPFTITAGTTLRTALQTLSDVMSATSGDIGFEFTVDPWLNLRIFQRLVDSTFFGPTDGVDWTIIPSAPPRPVSIRHTTDATGQVRQAAVYNTAGTLLVTLTDGTGLLGPSVQLTSPINDVNIATLLGRDYLTKHAGGKRGDVGVDARTDVTYGAAIGRVTIGPNPSIGTTTATVGAAQGVWLTYSVDLFNFLGTGVYDARFHYGGAAPSGANLIRSLTRNVLS